MAIHVVCMDGTNQDRVGTDQTNISKIFDSLGGVVIPGEDDGSFETSGPGLHGKYLPGVGSQGRPLLRVLGNAFGDGIAESIIRGYTFLSRNYAPGDQIFITGFSRGATAARALAGIVTGKGLLDTSRYDVSQKDTAYLRAIAAWYDYRRARPDLANQARLALIAFRTGHLPPVMTPADYRPPSQVQAVGVFDTVSSLGLPRLDSNGDAVFDFTIMDTTLNSLVVHGFHALAADETRDLFAPTFWADRDGIVQHIFPGAHSDVGGGYSQRGLSDWALDWMLTQLSDVGLPVDRSRIDGGLGPNPLDYAHDDATHGPFALTPRRPRAFPRIAKPSGSTVARWGFESEVLPGDMKAEYRATGTYTDGTAIYFPAEPVAPAPTPAQTLGSS